MRKDLTGKRFGKLVAVSRVKKQYATQSVYYWNCKCDCGKLTCVQHSGLMFGKAKSCGCSRFKTSDGKLCGEMFAEPQGRTKLYAVWTSMKQRCLNPKSDSYKWYGLNGVKVCSEWMQFYSFKQWALANGYADGLQIDRIEVTGDYSPSNCRFVKREVNQMNRRNTLKATFPDGVMTAKEASRIYGISYYMIGYWLRKGKSGVSIVESYTHQSRLSALKKGAV